ncbi:hypothetical protein BJV78DRAFT_1281811 [Lactifluus subvellereus]|nr:hypothetical protein BJV78DRAFT_1281811 [Lactifluus subvellereus]
MSTSPPIPADVAEIRSFSAAPLLLGPIWNWTLYGVLIVQLYVYIYNFQEDRKLLKLLVYAVFLLETLQTALSGADLYYWFVSGFGNVDHLNDPYMSAFDVPIIGSIVSLTVQFFFAYRVWVLSAKKSWLLCFSTVDATAAFAGGIYTHVLGKYPSGRTLKILALTWLTGNTVADALITAAMLYHLTRRRNAGDGYFSGHALSRIVRLTVETNLLTTTNGVIALLMVAIFPDKNWFVCPTAVLGKLYSNTLLVSLNNRISIREASTGRGAVPRAGPQAVTFPPSRVAAETRRLSLRKSSRFRRIKSGPKSGEGLW